jgi:hypothetical protein
VSGTTQIIREVEPNEAALAAIEVIYDLCLGVLPADEMQELYRQLAVLSLEVGIDTRCAMFERVQEIERRHRDAVRD